VIAALLDPTTRESLRSKAELVEDLVERSVDERPSADEKPVKQKVERVKLIAQLVSYLRHSMPQTGLLMWFDNAADALGERSPLQLLDDSVRTRHGSRSSPTLAAPRKDAHSG
jgi:hypothetical protein